MRHRRHARPMPGTGRLLLRCAVVALLAACHPSGPDAPFSAYTAQLSTALSVAIPDTHHTTVPSPPEARTVQLEISPGSLDQIDFLALSGCAVQTNILKRSSSLGQQAKSSQALLLTLEYLQLAPPCITRLRDDHKGALAASMEKAWRGLQAQLPALIFNATLGSDEYRAFWLTNRRPGEYPRVGRRVMLSALDSINGHIRRWLGGDYQAQNRDFEILLSEVAGGDGGALLQALARQGDWLAAADQMLEPPPTYRRLCSTDWRGTVAARLPGLSQHHFGKAINALTARTNRHYRELMQPIAKLEEQLSAALPPPYRLWMEDRNDLYTQLVAAAQRHLQRLSLIRQSCRADCEAPCPPLDNWVH